MKSICIKRAVVIGVLVLCLLFVISAPLFCAECNHDCTGEECFICLAVSSVRENYEHLLAWNQVLSFALVLFLSLTTAFVVSDIDALIITPIKLKVKLSN